MPEEHENSSTASGKASASSAGYRLPPTAAKKKRNLPGMPGSRAAPDAEVIALSPNPLLTTNRFVCEICNKGFQTDQNLQLHWRGHNQSQYKRDCRTLFSRMDNFIAHRAFCDALTEESAKTQTHVQGQSQVLVPANPSPDPDLRAQKPVSPPGSAAPASMQSLAAVSSTVLTNLASGLQEASTPPPQVIDEELAVTTNLIRSSSSSTSSTSNGKMRSSIPAGLFLPQLLGYLPAQRKKNL